MIVTFLYSCTDIFTSNLFSELSTDYSDMSEDQLQSNLASDGFPTDPDELQDVEDLLVEFRSELTDDILNDPDLLEQYVEDTTQLLDLNLQQADVEGLMADLMGASDGGGDLLSGLEDDVERLENLADAGDYAVEAFELDPDSLSTTQLVVGGVGLISDILQDDTLAAALEDSPTTETADLVAAGFDAQQISDIQTASAMMDAAEAGAEGDIADLLEGLPF